MTGQSVQRILTINAGSSSLKVALYEVDRKETRILLSEVTRIGIPGSRLCITDGHAAEAIALFSYQARKYLGALAIALGGLDTFVSTGGIGEHATAVRLRICESLEFLGIRLDPHRNEAHVPVISREGSLATVRVMKTDEDLMISWHTGGDGQKELVLGIGTRRGHEPEPATGNLMANLDPNRLQSNL
jgi:acetate kinase